jgi:hypothetical protein
MIIQNNRSSSAGSDINAKDWNEASYPQAKTGINCQNP